MPDKAPATDDQLLRQALCAADAASPAGLPTINVADLLAAAHRRRTHARQTRVAATVAVSIVLAIVLVQRPAAWFVSAPPSDSMASRTEVRSPSAEQLRAELAWLDCEAAVHQQIVRGLRRAQRQATDSAVSAVTDAVQPALALQEASRSAAISLQYAAMVEREADLQRARDEYQRVKRRFPGTSWAALAAASLDRMSSAAGDRPSL